jgi:hypothetical protein
MIILAFLLGGCKASPVTVSPSPTPAASTPAASTPAAVSPSPTPATSTPAAVSPSPTPAARTPAAVTPSPLPVDQGELGESSPDNAVRSPEASPTVEDEALGESSPENAARAVKANRAADSDPNFPAILAVPPGFRFRSATGDEGDSMTVKGDGGEVHIFLPNPDVMGSGLNSVTGPGGTFEASGWKRGFASSNQPTVSWSSNAVPFTGPDQLEGVVYLGTVGRREVRVTVSAPADGIDDFFPKVAPMIEDLRLR